MADVSVIIATHNRQLQVCEAIDSVLAQTEPVREVIVVDDGSTDDTPKQLAKYGNRIRILHQRQAGASAARNLGMHAAQGDWIAFLDDDDVWLETKIARQIELVNNNSALGLVYCSDHAVDEQLRTLYTRTAAPENRGDVFERLLIKNFIFTSCVIARRKAIEQAGYMQLEFRFAQDWDLWLKIAAQYPVDFAPEPLVLYRQSSSGCLTRDLTFLERLGELHAIQERALSLRRVSPAVRNSARSELELQWASSWLKEGKPGRALPHALRAATARPTNAEAYRLLLHSLVPARLRGRIKRLTSSGRT